MVRQRSPRPGVMTGHAVASGQGDVVLSQVMPGPPTLRGVSARPAVHVLRRGSQGFEVQKLQRQINARLTPCPGLAIDAVFGPVTEQAVIEYQKGVSIEADGIVGGHTWYHLVKGDRAVTVQPPAARNELAGSGPANVAKTVVNLPVAITALPAAPGIWEWPLDKKFADVLQRTAPKLPANMRHEFLGLLSPTNIAIMATCLVAWAGSHAFGVGEAIDVLLVGVGMLFVGMAIIDVAKEVGDCVLETTGATDEKDLEEAASHLARAIAIIGVLAFIALFAKVARGLGRKPVAGGEAPAKPPTSEVGTRSVEPNENVKPKPKETVATEKPKAEDGDGINSSDQGTNFNPQKPKGVPEAWKAEPGKKEGNTKWVNPDNPHDYVRAKPDGTVTQVRDGRAYDADGAKVDLKSPGAHGITPDRFIFRP